MNSIYIKIFLLSALILISLVVEPAFSDYMVIVNTENPITEISKKDLKRIYMMKKTEWNNDGVIQPVNLKENNAARKEFSESVLGKSSKKMEVYYLKRALAGIVQPPRSVRSDEDVIRYIFYNPGAVGYVSKADNTVKVIRVK
ncbi:MAG: hypothetical protein IEMM0002_1456 [bacterium]|nr:MAG: hypothetical protein IEMM0002_1456 [bacterium]